MQFKAFISEEKANDELERRNHIFAREMHKDKWVSDDTSREAICFTLREIVEDASPLISEKHFCYVLQAIVELHEKEMERPK
jgi:hypothetical protein